MIPVALSFGNVATAAEANTDEQSAQIKQLAAQVTYAEDLSAIKKLQRAYGYYLDKGLWEDLADLFTRDATANYPAGVYVGYDSIRKHLYENVGPGELGLGEGRLYNHMVLQPVVHLQADGRSAKGRWRAFAMFGRFGVTANWAEGIYEITYRKEQDVWKIHTLDYHSGFGAGYDGGWSRKRERSDSSAAPRPRRPPLKHAPDRPRNEACTGYPAACITPFHYGNPVSGGAGSAWPAASMQGPELPAGTKAGEQLADLSQRIGRLQDEIEIANLQRIYGYYLDRKQWDQVANLFAKDGSIELDQRGVYVGRGRIREFLGSLGPVNLSDGELNDHIQLQPVIHVAAGGGTAQARWRELAMTGVYQSHGSWSEGVYENTYVKLHGVWQIQALHFYPTFITDYDKGWAKDAQPAPGVNAELPPDRPPSAKYAIYPQQYTPPFHYKNPVSGSPPRYPSPPPRNTTASSKPTKRPSAEKQNTPENIHAGLLRTQQALQHVKDYHELENLQNAYGYYLDKNLWTDLANLFAEDGTMELAQRGVYVGRERIREFLDGFGPEGPRTGRLGNHLQLQPVIHVAPSGQTANIRIRLLQQMGEYGGRGSWGGAIYENQAVKIGGVWQLKTLHAFNTFTAAYEGGWAHSPGTRVPGPSKTNPPDKPVTFVFQMFPKVYPIPFHYSNPVIAPPD